MSFASWFERHFGFTGPKPTAVGPVSAAARMVLVHSSPKAAPTREEFDAWRDEPVTQFVMNALSRNAAECREKWMQDSWEAGEADQRTLDGLRERSDALLGFTADYDAFCETLGLEPKEEEQAA